MENTTARFKIYVICLNSYNHNKQHGKWIDVLQDENEIQKEIKQMLFESEFQPAKDYRIYDTEGFGDMKIPESLEIKTIIKIAQLINKYGEPMMLHIKHIEANRVNNRTEDHFLDVYCGEYESEKAFTIEVSNERDQIPEHLRHYVNYEQMTDDLFSTDYRSLPSSSGKKYIFSF